VITRLADAAVKASADLKATGRARIDLPYITADAGGPKHYQRDLTREEAERGMIEEGALLVDELMEWRGRDASTVALASWLESEADEDGGDGSLDAASVQRLANAAEQAMADIGRAGNAIVELPGLTKLGGGAFHFRRAFDRAALDEMIGEA
jgi:molecular chaperone DnaK (HSP70)